MRKPFRIFVSTLTLLAVLLASTLIFTPVRADSTITVNTTVDELNNNGYCSLREAIKAANTNTAVDTCAAGSGADTITLPAGTYTLTINGAGENANVTGDLDITGSLTINGAGAGTTIIRAGTLGYPNPSANGIDRVFEVYGAIIVSISDVTIANGKCTCTGSGIFNWGTLTVTNSTFSANSAVNGGGIFNNHTLIVTNSTFLGNSTTYWGGGIYNFGTLTTVTNSTFSGNFASKSGGGIYNSIGTVTLTNSTFSGNSAYEGGGGIDNVSPGTLTVTNSAFSANDGFIGSGGGIKNQGTLTVTNSTFSGNSAFLAGGIYNSASLYLKNTILANSINLDCYNNSGDAIATDINNLIETNGGSGHKCGTPAVTSDPDLGALADNGGPTQTFAITSVSSAYNAGDNAVCAASLGSPNYGAGGLDQRGMARPQSGTCDIGSYELDDTAPAVSSSTRVNPSPTSLASVSFTVTFSEVVTDVDAADFNLTLTGVTGAKVTAVSGSGVTRTVTVNTGTGSGTLRLNVVDNDTILDAVGNKLGGTGAGNGNYTAGQSYTIADKTAPKVISSVRVNPSRTNLARVKFTVRFSEAVTGVDAADFSLTLTGVKRAKVTAVSGSGATRTVTVSTGTGNGRLRLNVIDNDTIRDAAGNKLGGTGLRNGNYTAGQSYALDKTAPKVVSSVRANPNPTKLSSVKFTVKFSEVVTGVDVADFNLTLTGVKGAKVTTVSGSGATRTVTVRTGTGNGTLRLNVVDNDTILDRARNKLGGAGAGNGNFTTGQTYTIAKTALTVDKDAPDTLLDATPTGLSNSASAIFTFSSTDGSATFECSLDGSAYAACTSPTDYADLAEGSHSFEVRAVDPSTNVDASPASLTWTIDTTAPTVISSLPVSTDLTDAVSVDFIVTFSETVSGVDVSDFSLIPTEIADATITAVSGSGTTYTVTVSTGTGTGTLRLDVVDDDTILDEVGNPLGGIGWENGNYTAVEGYTISKP